LGNEFKVWILDTKFFLVTRVFEKTKLATERCAKRGVHIVENIIVTTLPLTPEDNFYQTRGRVFSNDFVSLYFNFRSRLQDLQQRIV
jgi:hypothetical protein